MKPESRVFTSSKGARATLFLQDCIEGMKQLPKKSVSVIVTSPPYNIGINYSKYNDNVRPRTYYNWMRIWGETAREVLADNGSLFLNIGSRPTDPTLVFWIAAEMARVHFYLQNVIHWVKSIAILKSEVGNYPGITQDVVVGHYKPINSNRFLNDCHEYILHFTKDGHVPLDRLAVGVPYQDKSNIKRWANGHGDLHCRGNTWFIPYETINSREKDRPHPATFPIELPVRCIRLHGIEHVNLVMDPFMGIGTSAIAAAKLGKNFVGYEIAPDYFAHACDRLISMHGDTVIVEEDAE